jgi:Tfp pilus assembly protein PilF
MAFFFLLFCLLATPVLAEEGLPRIEQARPLTKAQKLNAIYGALAKAKTRQEAQPLEAAFEKVNLEHESATTRLTLQRAFDALQKGQRELALHLFEEIIAKNPSFTAAFVRRAMIYESAGQTGPAMNDLNAALKLDPRHYAALMLSAQIFLKIEQPALALKAFERAIAVNPQLPRVKEQIEKLKGTRL